MNLNDERFFTECINYDTDGLNDVRVAAKEGDFNAARKHLSKFVRESLKPDIFLTTVQYKSNETDNDTIIKLADDAKKHLVVSCGIPYDFKDEKVDWYFNPTHNGYREWPFQLNRHREFLNLARGFRLTGDKSYASACAELFESWADHAIAPEQSSGYSTVAWRTIECGIRQSEVWPEVIHTFYNEFSDDVLVDWCKSVWEHGERLYRDHTTGSNWLLMEMNGLCHISVIYPWFTESEKWYQFSVDTLNENLDIQVYPDGAQFELTTDYQWVTIKNYIEPLRLLRVYKKDVSQKTLQILEKMVMFYIRLRRPDGRVPSINDGSLLKTDFIVNAVSDLFPDNDIFNWAIGKSNTAPAEKSYVFEYPGLAALRTGWNKNDSYVFFDGGEFGKGHQHEDKLSILFYADGKTIVAEGNSYAYDDSQMRKYVISSRAHNTVMIDSLEQNRRTGYTWNDERINQKSDLVYNLSDTVDALSAVYDEGYGENQDRLAVHKRNVYFVKKMDDLKPFVITADRLESDSEHNYEIMWHLDAEKLSTSNLTIKADTLSVLTSKSDASLDICYGKTFPEWQGWTANSTVQSDFRPIYNASYFVVGKSLRVVTVLYPDGGENTDIIEVIASENINDSKIILKLNTGKTIEFDEKDYI